VEIPHLSKEPDGLTQQWLEDHEDKVKQLTNWMKEWMKQ
jgi:hypothetical protein